MNDRLAIIAVRDILRTYLTDPRQQYGEPSREFIHTDEPLISAKYPRIESKNETTRIQRFFRWV